MFKAIVKGFTEMMNAIREECTMPSGEVQTNWEYIETENLIEARAGLR